MSSFTSVIPVLDRIKRIECSRLACATKHNLRCPECVAMNAPDMLVDFISLCQKAGHTGGLVVHASNSSTLKAEAG